MAKGRPLKDRPDRRLPKTATPTAGAYLARREAAILTAGEGFAKRMLSMKEGPGAGTPPALNVNPPTHISDPGMGDGVGEGYDGIDPPAYHHDNDNHTRFQESSDPLVAKLKSALIRGSAYSAKNSGKASTPKCLMLT